MTLEELREAEVEHLASGDAARFTMWHPWPTKNKIVLELWEDWDCGCGGGYHSSCGSSRLVKSLACDRPHIRVKAGKD